MRGAAGKRDSDNSATEITQTKRFGTRRSAIKSLGIHVKAMVRKNPTCKTSRTTSRQMSAHNQQLTRYAPPRVTQTRTLETKHELCADDGRAQCTNVHLLVARPARLTGGVKGEQAWSRSCRRGEYSSQCERALCFPNSGTPTRVDVVKLCAAAVAEWWRAKSGVPLG